MSGSESGRLKVLLLTTSMAAGGSQRFVTTLLDHLDRTAFEPEVALMLDGPGLEALPSDVPVTIVTAEERACPATPLELPADLQCQLEGDAAWVQELVDQVAHVVCRLAPDVVLCAPEWASVPAAAALSAFPASTRLICRFGARASLAFPENVGDPLFPELARTYLGRAHRIVAVSRAIQEDLIEGFGIDPDRIAVMGNGVDVEHVQSLSKAPVAELATDSTTATIVFVGRLERVKGLEYLLRATARAAATNPARCVLVGAGSREGYLRALVIHLGIQESVEFVGEQVNPYRFMSRATVFVLPSLSEGMPNVLLEAMACGCPVIATDVEGGVVRDLLEDGACGVIVPRGDERALADAIVMLVRDRGLRERLAEQGLRRAREFDLRQVVREFEALINRVAMGENPVTEKQGEPATTQVEGRCDTSAPMSRHPAVELPTGLVQEEGSREARVASEDRASITARVASSVLKTLRTGFRSTRKYHAPKRLIVLVPSPSSANMGTLTEVLVRYLGRERYDVTLLTLFDEPRSDEHAPEEDAIRLLHRPDGPPIDIRCIVSAVPAGCEPELEQLAVAAGKVGELASELHAEAILADGFMAAHVALVAKRCVLPRLPVIFKTHGGARDIAAGSQGQLEALLLHELLGTADGVLAADEPAAAEVRSLFDTLRERTTVVVPSFLIDSAALLTDPVGDTPGHPWLAEADPLFVYVHEDGDHAGADALMRAVSIAASKSHFRLLVVAAEDDAAAGVELQARFAGLPTEQVGFVVGEEWISQLLPQAVALVYLAPPPLTGIPLAIVKSMLVGCAVLSTASPSEVRTLLEQDGPGLVVPAGDDEGLAEAMLQLLWDEESRRELGSLGPARLHPHTMEALCEKVDTAIASAVNMARQ